jgi:hypothetical protein
MDDITAQLSDAGESRKLLNGAAKPPPTYKSLDEVTPTMDLAKIKAWRRLEAAVASLKQILPPGKMDPVPQRIIVELIMDPEHAKWYFQPDLEKDKAELGTPLPCDRPLPITRSDLAVYMLHAPTYLNFVYALIDKIGDLGLAYYLAHEKMQFTPLPRHAVDSVTDSLVGPPAFVVDHYMLVVNIPETRRRHLSSVLPRFAHVRASTPRPSVYDSSDYDEDSWGWTKDAAAGTESDSDSAVAGGLTLLPPELKTATSSRSLPPLNRGRLVLKE